MLLSLAFHLQQPLLTLWNQLGFWIVRNRDHVIQTKIAKSIFCYFQFETSINITIAFLFQI